MSEKEGGEDLWGLGSPGDSGCIHMCAYVHRFYTLKFSELTCSTMVGSGVRLSQTDERTCI